MQRLIIQILKFYNNYKRMFQNNLTNPGLDYPLDKLRLRNL